MAASGGKSKSLLGFLTVVEDADVGLIGGYLVLNTAGRPEEFHCTAPIRPNRAQQILYGPTLQPYLFGEQIGRTLLGKSKAQPLVVCTDREPVLAVRECIDWPVALVLPGQVAAGANAAAAGVARRVDAAHAEHGTMEAFHLGRNHLAVPRSQDRDLIHQRLAELGDGFDLAEPFDRIREAIEEARRGGQ